MRLVEVAPLHVLEEMAIRIEEETDTPREGKSFRSYIFSQLENWKVTNSLIQEVVGEYINRTYNMIRLYGYFYSNEREIRYRMSFRFVNQQERKTCWMDEIWDGTTYRRETNAGKFFSETDAEMVEVFLTENELSESHFKLLNKLNLFLHAKPWRFMYQNYEAMEHGWFCVYIKANYLPLKVQVKGDVCIIKVQFANKELRDSELTEQVYTYISTHTPVRMELLFQ